MRPHGLIFLNQSRPKNCSTRPTYNRTATSAALPIDTLDLPFGWSSSIRAEAAATAAAAAAARFLMEYKDTHKEASSPTGMR
ncbi:hypothetical protein Emag_006397 [Eimeria magna]